MVISPFWFYPKLNMKGFEGSYLYLKPGFIISLHSKKFKPEAVECPGVGFDVTLAPSLTD